MKNFEISAYGVEELSKEELKQTDGGTQMDFLIVRINTDKPRGHEDRVQWIWELW